MKLSLILPVLNESARIVQQLQRLQCLRERGHEILVIDGGSHNDTAELAAVHADRVETWTASRSGQMNRGAEIASGELLLFLHVDTVLPDHADQLIDSACQASQRQWGWFDVRLSNSSFPYRLISRMMNWRARLTSICTGDQAMFVAKDLFHRLGGYPAIPLMEDIAMSKSLRRTGKPICIGSFVVTSSRRWEQYGLLNTVLLMWRLRLLYLVGVSPARLAKQYYPDR